MVGSPGLVARPGTLSIICISFRHRPTPAGPGEPTRPTPRRPQAAARGTARRRDRRPPTALSPPRQEVEQLPCFPVVRIGGHDLLQMASRHVRGAGVTGDQRQHQRHVAVSRVSGQGGAQGFVGLARPPGGVQGDPVDDGEAGIAGIASRRLRQRLQRLRAALLAASGCPSAWCSVASSGAAASPARRAASASRSRPVGAGPRRGPMVSLGRTGHRGGGRRGTPPRPRRRAPLRPAGPQN